MDRPAEGPADVETLRSRLADAEETLRAIRDGEVDALLIADAAGDRVYTLRGADAPYRALVEQMQEGAAVLGAGDHIIYCNRRFAELLDTPIQRVIGGSVDRFVDPPDQGALRILIRSGVGKLRTRLCYRGGLPVEVQISISSATLDGVDHRTVIVTDISMLTKAQRENRSKDEFLAMLAHELRNPLGAISNAAQVLRLAELSEPRVIRARDVIDRQMQQLARLVDDLLDVSRVMTGKIGLNRHPIDLAECVTSSIGAIASSDYLQGRLEVAADPVWVHADAARLEQVVGNLVANALKFSPPDSRIRVSVTIEGDDAVLRVADDGIGIDADLLPHVFDLFVQADDSVSRSKGGLGIGLTLVRRLVALHGGTVDASSPGPGRGAEFTVRLPAVTAAVSTDTAGPTTVRRRSRRVLLIDDHKDSREMCRLLLQAEGHEVFEAEDGAAALAAFRETRPDLAVIDIGLPGMNGYDIARQIRAEAGGRRVTLIALTGYGFPEDRERSRAAGFDQHLVKPASPVEMLRELADFRE